MNGEAPRSSDDRTTLTLVDGRLPELDGVRGLAVLFILIWHFVGIPLHPAGIHLTPGIWALGFKNSLIIFKSGVDLFFVLSGFLITGILLDHSASSSYYRTFFARRICRTFPLFYILLAIFVVARAAGASGPLFAGAIPLEAYVSMTQNYFMAHRGSYGAIWLSATWSLAIEEQFYLVFPFVVRCLRGVLLPLLGAGIIGAAALRVGCYWRFGDDWAAYTWLPCRIDSLCWGAAIAYLIRKPYACILVIRHRRILTAAWLVLLAAVGILDIALGRNIGYHMSIWGNSLLAAFYALAILLAVLYRGHPSTSLLRATGLIALARISYGVSLLSGTRVDLIF